MTSAERPIKLIYICGYGRSGSTLLDICLDQDPDVFGAGEVSTVPRHVWANDEYCACGQPVRSCPLWSEIVGRWQSLEGEGALAELRRDEEQLEGLFSWARLTGSAALDRYGKRTAALFRLVSEVTGKEVIVDSSKLPGRGFALAANPQIDLHVLHLVRDGRGVAWSLMKAYHRDVESGLQKEITPKSWFYTAVRWTIVNLAAELLCWRVGKRKSARVRYEDFASDPHGTITGILALAAGSSGRRSTGELHPAHQVAGNRLRMQSAIRVRKDEGWRREMPAWKQRAFSIMCAPLLWRYGYFRREEPVAKQQAPALSN